MNFTREPIVETVITPKDGFKLVIRNSKGGGQEEFFVDAVEVISFGNTSFFRSLEKPKSFLVSVNDYEVLETREVRMSLKATASERAIKIAGGREATKAPKEPAVIRDVEAQAIAEQKAEKRNERRRYRKKRTQSDQEEIPLQETSDASRAERPSLIPPPSTLISDSIEKYKDESIVASDKAPNKEPLLPPPPPLVQKLPESQEDNEIST